VIYPGTAAATSRIRRLVGERPTAHVDSPAPAGAWRGAESATLWPNADLHGVDLRERWIRLSTGDDALFMRAHEWAPAERSRYLAVRLVEDGVGRVRVVEQGCLRLVEVVGLLAPATVGRNRRSHSARQRLRSLLAEVAVVVLGGLAVVAAGSAVASVAVGAALQ
jgi:hypothetical protein